MEETDTPAADAPPKVRIQPYNYTAAYDKSLTPEDWAFIREYAAQPNVRLAAMRVFPHDSPQTARNHGHDILAKPAAQEELKRLQREHARECKVSARKAIRELARIAFSDPADAIIPDPDGVPVPRKWSDLTPSARHAIASVKVTNRSVPDGEGGRKAVTDIEYKYHDKLKALELLCRRLGIDKSDLEIELLRAESKKLSEPTVAVGPSSYTIQLMPVTSHEQARALMVAQSGAAIASGQVEPVAEVIPAAVVTDGMVGS